MAAITAARVGARVIVLERQDRVGKKLLATGNGRCNLTNLNATISNYHGVDASFVCEAFARLPIDKTIAFFNNLGICTSVEEEGRVFPLVGQASAVLDVLRFEAARLGAEIRTDYEVTEMSRKGALFVVRGLDETLSADRVIMAAGGKAAPQLGGSDSGISLLKKLGHDAAAVFPALVPLKTDWPHKAQLKGVKVVAKGELIIAGKVQATETGEYLFTEYGLSGPPILQMSQAANRALASRQTVHLLLDLFPSWSFEKLLAELSGRCNSRPEAALEFQLVGLIHKRFIPALLKDARIVDAKKPGDQTGNADMSNLAALLKSWRFNINGSMSWRDAQLMAGGVLTKNFSPETMESRLLPGLYAAGEVLDISGDCGGYNLQWAWSSGYVAGTNAAHS